MRHKEDQEPTVAQMRYTNEREPPLTYVLENWKKMELKIDPRFGNGEIVNST